MVDRLGLWCQEWLHLEYWETEVGMIIDWGSTYTYWVCHPDQGGGGAGGGGAGTGNPQAVLPKQKEFRELRQDFTNWFNNSGDACAGKMAAMGFAQQITAAVAGVDFYDLDQQVYGGDWEGTLGEEAAFWFVGPNATDSNQTLNQWFDSLFAAGAAGGPRAATFPHPNIPYDGIYFRSTETNFFEQHTLLLHELMHTIINNPADPRSLDEQLAAALNLIVPPPAAGQNAAQAASQAVSNWFNGGCP